MTSDYRPIACGLYDRFELLAMHGEPVELEVGDEHGRGRCLAGRVRDVEVRDGAEYLVLEDTAGERHELRLDRLLWVRSRSDDWSWRQESGVLDKS